MELSHQIVSSINHHPLLVYSHYIFCVTMATMIMYYVMQCSTIHVFTNGIIQICYFASIRYIIFCHTPDKSWVSCIIVSHPPRNHVPTYWVCKLLKHKNHSQFFFFFLPSPLPALWTISCSKLSKCMINTGLGVSTIFFISYS